MGGRFALDAPCTEHRLMAEPAPIDSLLPRILDALAAQPRLVRCPGIVERVVDVCDRCSEAQRRNRA